MTESGIARFKAAKLDAKSFLRTNYPSTLITSVPGRVDAIRAESERPTTNEGKIRLLTLAYALVLVHGSEKKILNALAGDPARQKSLKQPARVFLAVLYLADNGMASTKTLSRWCKAIEYLQQSRIKPSEIDTLRRQKGEGIDKWSRGGQKASQTSASPMQTHALVTIQHGPLTRTWKIDQRGVFAALKKALKTTKPSTSRRSSSVSRRPQKSGRG